MVWGEGRCRLPSAGYGKGWAFSSSEKAAKEGVEWLSYDLQLQKNQSQGPVNTSSGLRGKGNHRKPREETSAMIWEARAGALTQVGASGHMVV